MKTSQNKIDFNKVVAQCQKIADAHIKNWHPIDPSWKTVTGAAYLRLSDEEQVRVENGSLEQQVHMAIAEAEARSKNKSRNYRITKFYIEPGISGRKSNRKQFVALKKAIRLGEHSFIAFKEISRIARDSLLWKEFFKLCHSKRCEIVLRGLPIDPNDPAQILQLDIIAAFAEYEAANSGKRIKDSVHSAMVTSGKFNATHKVLGLDPLVENGRKRSGFYQVNATEMVTVRWMFETFVKYGSHQVTIEKSNAKGIKNWNGEPFGRHSLVNLLSNTRYIGKWYVNRENKNAEDADSLPDHQRHREIDLPLGPVIPLELWERAQKTLKQIAGNLGKNTRVTRVYPLSGGILQLADGTTFRGCSGNGKTKRSHYYHNGKHGFSINTSIIEKCVAETVARLIENSSELQAAIRKAGEDTQDQIQFLNQRASELHGLLRSNNNQKMAFLQNMKLLTADSSDRLEVEQVRSEFKSLFDRLTYERKETELQIEHVESELRSIQSKVFSWAEIARHARSVQEVMTEKDPVALKRAYYGLFKAIVIGEENADGIRPLTFILMSEKDESLEDAIRLRREMVEAGGIEPPSVSLSC